jgi:cytochrome c oxidase subunit 1
MFNVVRSVRRGVPAGPDPWKGNTLEWFTSSPPPVNNFDVVPRVRSVEPMKDIRRQIERQSELAEAPAAPTTESSIRA